MPKRKLERDQITNSATSLGPIVGGKDKPATSTEEIAPFPKVLTKRMMEGMLNKKLHGDALNALYQISDQFMYRALDDLCAYSTHAKRKTIGYEDVELLFKRQRLITPHQSLRDLIRKHLAQEDVDDLLNTNDA